MIFEYRSLHVAGTFTSESALRRLNELGLDGWEVVSFNTVPENSDCRTVFLLKRRTDRCKSKIRGE